MDMGTSPEPSHQAIKATVMAEKVLEMEMPKVVLVAWQQGVATLNPSKVEPVGEVPAVVDDLT